MLKRLMKPKYYRYELWEDYKNGMYHTKIDGNEKIRKEQALILFKDLDKLYENMKYVSFNWKYASETNLTNPSVNYQAWLGQASNCYYTGCSDEETIEVWHLLTDEEREKANNVADKVFEEWSNYYLKQQDEYQYNIFDMEV